MRLIARGPEEALAPGRPVPLQQLLAQVRRIEIRARRLVNEGLAGEYLSVFKGRGMEFHEVREYQPGDDIRSIDWNVTARMGHPFVKRYVEERELTVLFVVDGSGSQFFGTGPKTKGELGAEVAALIAFAAIKNNDRVGLMVFTDRIEMYIPPAKGSRHVLRIVRELLSFRSSSRGTDISAALQAAGRLLRRRAVVFLISDFRDRDFHSPLSIAGRRHDLVALRISDPREGDLPDCGLIEMADPETGRRVLVDTSSEQVRSSVARVENERTASLEKLFRRAGVDQVVLSTDRPYDRPLVIYFRKRARRV